MIHRPLAAWCCAALYWMSMAVSATASASDQAAVEALLANSAAPVGVVFEIVSGDEADLTTSLPRTRIFIDQLRDKFTDLPVAVVTHGSEQFSLMSSRADDYAAVHDIARSLRVDDDVTVEVCGNHASMRGVATDAFSKDVSVVPAAPATIRAYVDRGYTLIVVN